MIRMIDLIKDKKSKKPSKKEKEQEEEEKEKKQKSTDMRIFPRPEEQKQKIEEEHEEPVSDESMFPSEQEVEALPKKEITEISTLDKAIKLYDVGIKLVDKISKKESIDLNTWQEIKEFMDKIVDMIKNDPKVTTDVATNYFSNSSYLHDTIMNTCLLAIHTGIGLKYSKEELIELGIAAFLHDIGMFDIEDLVNQNDKLTRKQWKTLKKHPNHSARKLENIPEVTDGIKRGISQAHEKIDGSGYPEGLKGDDVHKYAQIIGVTNVYEAMTHPRPHKEKRLPYDAMKVIITLAGKEYNSRIARTFVNQISLYPVGSLVELNNGAVAKVVEANSNFPLRPVVAMLLDKSGNRLKVPEAIDLRKNMILHIKKLISPEKVNITHEEILNLRGKSEE